MANWKYKLCLIKAYYEKGLNLLNYPIKAMIVIGLGAVVKNYKMSYIIAGSIIMGIFAFLIGLYWYKWGFINEEIEVSNKFNYFVNEMRRKFK